MVVAEAKALGIHRTAILQSDPIHAFTSHSQDSPMVELYGAMENNVAKASDSLSSTLVDLRIPVEAVTSDTNLPKNNTHGNAEKGT